MATLSRIAPEIPVADVDQAIAYYTQKLGFELAMEMAHEYAIVERDGIAIHLFRHSGTSTPAGVHIFTQDLDELQRELGRRGATISVPITRRHLGRSRLPRRRLLRQHTQVH